MTIRGQGMKWHCLTSAAFVVAVTGCVTAGSEVRPQEVAAAMQSGTARSQKPEDGPVAALAPPQKVPVEGEIAAKARALVNGEAILTTEIEPTLKQYRIQMQNAGVPEPQMRARLQEVLRAELEKIIERELILGDALNRLKNKPGAIEKLREAAAKEFDKQVRSMKERIKQQGFPCETDEQFVALLEQQGMSLEAMRRQSERSFMAMEYMRHRIFRSIEGGVNHRTVREYYDEHPGEFQSEDRVKWLDIFIATAKYASPGEARKVAEEVAARVQKGEDFAALSKKYDDGDSVLRQGYGTGQKRGEVRPPEAEPILFRMSEGTVGPIIETYSGFHVIKLVEREYAGLHPFDEKTQSEIKKKLQGIIADREYKRLVEDLKRKATVQIIDE